MVCFGIVTDNNAAANKYIDRTVLRQKEAMLLWPMLSVSAAKYTKDDQLITALKLEPIGIAKSAISITTTLSFIVYVSAVIFHINLLYIFGTALLLPQIFNTNYIYWLFFYLGSRKHKYVGKVRFYNSSWVLEHIVDKNIIPF